MPRTLTICLLGLSWLLGSCSVDGTSQSSDDGLSVGVGISDSGEEASSLPAGVVGTVWEWTRFVTPVDAFDLDAPEAYTVLFQKDGTVAVRCDCNRGSAKYTVPSPKHIELGPMAMTRAMCAAGSRGDQFAQLLQEARIVFMADGNLYMDLPMDSGTLHFRPQR